MYVTLANPITPNRCHTVVHLACSEKGATTASQAVANTWSLFEGPADVKTWDGVALHYYQSGIAWANHVTDVAGLLSFRNGQCAAWQKLLECAWQANGVVSERASASPTTSAGFLVKNWLFGNPALTRFWGLF